MNRAVSTQILQSTFRYCLIWMSLSLGVFLFFNWNLISDPTSLPSYYGSQSIFGHGRADMALYKFWMFFFPLAVIPYLIVVEVLLMGHLLIRKHLNIRVKTWLIVSIGFLLCGFSNDVIDLVYNWSVNNQMDKWLYIIRDISLALGFILTLILALGSGILMFTPQFKKYRTWFVINLLTVILFVSYCYGYVKLFFD